ncbi:hypothetical protein EXIGLDRAFT_41103 [Exidia glandulosa HHB12029]|uniref:DUF6534 domain-containing protein n=1 Tax=Exidia glandulosa HHB12029 TaxID=1314781 RepID=A0A166MSB7_EXIGL|nr:hypothetical protein EXIGLDRAFT_41103 [Exidia glandulosa HHB12029]
MATLLVGTNVFLVQTFFCLRVYRITRSRVLALFAFTLVLTRLIIHVCIMVTIIKATTFSVVRSSAFKWQATSLLIIGATSDVIIALSICFALTRMRSGFTASDRLVDKLVAFTIGSGLLTSVVAVVEMITYLTMQNLVFLGFFSVLGKLYSNSLLTACSQSISSGFPWHKKHGETWENIDLSN